MCLKEVGLQAQNTVTILGSIINIIWEDLYDHSMTTRIFALISNNNIHMTFKIYEKSDYKPRITLDMLQDLDNFQN